MKNNTLRIKDELSNIEVIEQLDVYSDEQDNMINEEYYENNFYLHFPKEKILQKEQTTELFKQLKTEKRRAAIKEIKNKIFEGNARLILKYASKYKVHCKHLDIDDLFQAGALGMFHAIDRFEVEQGYAFSTYATHWIKQSILREIERNEKAIRLPAYLEEKRLKYQMVKKYLTNVNSQEPTEEEVVAYLQKIDPEAKYTLKNVFDFSMSSTISSLDAELEGEETNKRKIGLGDLLSGSEDVEDSVLTAINTDQLYLVMKKILKEKEYDIVIRRYGQTKETLQEIAQEYGVSRERIRQIEERALGKLQKALPKYGFTKEILYK